MLGFAFATVTAQRHPAARLRLPFLTHRKLWREASVRFWMKLQLEPLSHHSRGTLMARDSASARVPFAALTFLDPSQ